MTDGITMGNPAIIKTIVIFAVVLTMSLIGAGIYFFFFHNKKKGYPFLLYSRDGTTAKEIIGKVKIDPQNKSKKSFAFDIASTELIIQPPTLHMDKKAFREVTWTDDGELTYIANKQIDRSLLLTKAILPEEKQISLMRMKENNERYQNPINKWQALIMGLSLLLIFLLLGGIIFTTIQYGKISQTHVTLAKENKETAKEIKSATDNLVKIAEQQTSITASLTGKYNITRQII